MNQNRTPAITPLKLCFVALCVVINIIGGQLALMLKLPIYLDSIGTILVACLLGPIYGMIPNTLSGLIFGLTTDIYSLYFAPVGIILGFVTGLVCRKGIPQKAKLPLAALFITVPATIVSSCICAFLFGGITSSGSTILVQLLAKTPLGLTGSVFAVQLITDYLDRVISLILAVILIKALPADMHYHLTRKEEPSC